MEHHVNNNTVRYVVKLVSRAKIIFHLIFIPVEKLVVILQVAEHDPISPDFCVSIRRVMSCGY